MISYIAKSDLGRRRENNEDNYIECIDAQGRQLLLGVIDGVGGYAGGEVAAQICRDTIEAGYAELCATAPELLPEALRRLVVRANNAIIDRQEQVEELRSMSCVLSFALLDYERESLYYAHVGDSRGYILRGNELSKFTHDHSMVGYLEETGSISEEAAMSHPRRNEVSKLLGERRLTTEDHEYVEVGAHSFYGGDCVLFCSDGLSDLVPSLEIAQILLSGGSLEARAQQLIAQANEYGGKDNITVALASYAVKEAYQPIGPKKEQPKLEVPYAEPERESQHKTSWGRILGGILLSFVLGLALGYLLGSGLLAQWGLIPQQGPQIKPTDSTLLRIEQERDSLIYKADTLRQERDSLQHLSDSLQGRMTTVRQALEGPDQSRRETSSTPAQH
ncbi:MAG: protein phosphatase 2C domain-containing protein [Porphyromonas sp.]|nr:protein phosphatase 2C domain-containing protein [Porphyromonas sp.]